MVGNAGARLRIVDTKTSRVESKGLIDESEYVFNRVGLEKILEHFIAKSIHDSFEGVNVENNVSALFSWAKEQNVSEEDIFEGIEYDILERVKSGNGYITNASSVRIFQNIAIHLDLNPEDFEKIGYEVMNSSKKMKVFLNSVGRNLSAAAAEVGVVNALMNKTKQFNVFQRNLDGGKIQTTLKVDPLAGNVSPKCIRYWSFGMTKAVIGGCLDNVEEILFDEGMVSGGWEVTTISTPTTKREDLISKLVKGGSKWLKNRTIERNSLYFKYVDTQQKELMARVNKDLYVTKMGMQSHISRHPGTGYHELRTTLLALIFGYQLGLSNDQMRVLSLGGPVHDHGKLSIEDTILHFEGNLRDNDDAYQIMRSHATLGRLQLLFFDDRNLREEDKIYGSSVSRIATEHQENADGSGYPFGVNWKQTSLAGLLFRIVDGCDALNDVRIYQNGKSLDEITKIFEGDIERGILHEGLTTFFLENTLPYLKSVGYDAKYFDPTSHSFLETRMSSEMGDLIAGFQDYNSLLVPKNYSPVLRKFVLTHDSTLPGENTNDEIMSLICNLVTTYKGLDDPNYKKVLKRVVPKEIRSYFPDDGIIVI